MAFCRVKIELSVHLPILICFAGVTTNLLIIYYDRLFYNTEFLWQKIKGNFSICGVVIAENESVLIV